MFSAILRETHSHTYFGVQFNSISQGQREQLTAPFSDQEIKEAVDDTRHHIGVTVDLRRSVNGVGGYVGPACPQRVAVVFHARRIRRAH